MGEVGGNSGCADDIVAGEFGHFGGEFAEEGEGLADATGGTEDGDFGLVGCGGGESAGGLGAEGADGSAGETIDDHG